MRGKSHRKKLPLAYRERMYRMQQESGLVSSFVKMVETDLHILAPEKVEDEAIRLVAELRGNIEGYIRKNPVFADSLAPLPLDPNAPVIVREMLIAGIGANVGPMAAVAGAIAEGVGHGLMHLGIGELIVENGGDIFLFRDRESVVAVYAGESPLSNKVGIRIDPDFMPCGVCCSSGTIGHSLSFGHADAVVVVASSTAQADAAATRLGNEVKEGPSSIQKALDKAKGIPDISGVLIIKGDRLGAWGEIQLERL